MSLVGFKAQNHDQQIRRRGANPDVDDRATSPEVFEPLMERFGFTLDAAASSHNTKCGRYFSIEQDGLAQSWAGERVWCNPPFSDIASWVAKAWHEWLDAPEHPELIVMLLPANRTEQSWWQEMVEPFRDRPPVTDLRTEFFKGRLRFIHKGQTEILPNQRPPFGCVLLIWSRNV